MFKAYYSYLQVERMAGRCQQRNLRYGTVNIPRDVDRFWTAEMSFTFDALAANSSRSSPTPANNEVWFINFGRSEQSLSVTADSRYVVYRNIPTQWWSWQPCNAVNLQLQGGVWFSFLATKNPYMLKWH